ncbi:MAG: M48 family metallopeptidase [Chromatiales bacterium]|nr:M48 family metallopeptidase [Chromatiales bacterium]
MGVDKLERDFRYKVNAWARKIRVFPHDVRIERLEKKWGFCTADGFVTFNSELLFLDEAIQDYVIIHELLHLKVSHHGKLFRSLMSVYLPDWQKQEVKLSKEATRI